MLYQRDSQQNRQYALPHAEFTSRSSSQHAAFKQAADHNNNQPKHVPRIHIIQPFRVTFSLLIAGLALALCLLYSWTTLLILSLVCAAITLMMIHLLFDEEIDTRNAETSDDPRQQQYMMPNTAYSLPYRAMEQVPIVPAPSSQFAPMPVSSTNAQPLEEISPVQPNQYQSGDAPTFPTTPMPTTPIVRVLETIDLSSTNVEHFLDIHNEWHGMQSIPLSQLPEEVPLTEQEESPIERQQED